MAASASDFQWYHDVDDEHPIGNDHQLLSPTSPVSGPSMAPSARVRLLCGQPKLTITKNVVGLPKKRKAKGKQKAPTPGSESDNDISSDSEEDADLNSLAANDQSVCIFSSILSYLSTNMKYYRNVPRVTAFATGTSVVRTLISYSSQVSVARKDKCKRDCGVSSASKYQFMKHRDAN